MLNSAEILNLRPPKNTCTAAEPYAILQEEEIGTDGKLQQVHTVFLTNSECPFRCVMCDLWKNTLPSPTPPGAVPAQIRFAQERLGEASVIKLYNSGNFFDAKAIPTQDYPEIVKLTERYERVIVENHPRLTNENILPFRDMVSGQLEMAIGIETVHPEVLQKLNKQVTLGDIRKTARFLSHENIDMRGFVLFNPPFMLSEKEHVTWCLKSVKFAFDEGFSAVSIIPVRTGNGAMEVLEAQGDFVPANLSTLEDVFDEAMSWNRGRVFADTWDLYQFSDCDVCFEARKQRLEIMNKTQRIVENIDCKCIRSRNES